MEERHRYRSILLFGMPGSGKGTQGAVLGQLPSFVHISMGDVFRKIPRTGKFGREIEHASKLNSIVMADARSLSAEWLRARVLSDQSLREPLASQVRGLVGLKGQRYALLPVELRLESHGGTGVAILRVIMIDARMAKILSVFEVASDPMTSLSPALTASVARHFADLVVAP